MIVFERIPVLRSRTGEEIVWTNLTNESTTQGAWVLTKHSFFVLNYDYLSAAKCCYELECSITDRFITSMYK